MKCELSKFELKFLQNHNFKVFYIGFYRYQLLHVLSKEVINRWQGLVDEHRTYEEKLSRMETWLAPLEQQLESLKQSVPGETGKLSVLSTEKEQASHKVSDITTAGERLFPDTAAPGRECIRSQLRALRDRLDVFEQGIEQEQRRQDAQSIQWSSYQETLGQTLSWLETMEKLLQQEPAASWSSVQEIRSKLLKHKVM